MEQVITSLVMGAIGGNLGGMALKNLSLGTVGNSIAGIVGGGLGGQLLGMVGAGGMGDAVAGAAGLDIGGLLQQAAGGGVGGIVVMAIVGMIKKTHGLTTFHSLWMRGPMVWVGKERLGALF